MGKLLERLLVARLKIEVNKRGRLSIGHHVFTEDKSTITTLQKVMEIADEAFGRPYRSKNCVHYLRLLWN